MIGSGTENDPWVPLTAAELKDCWSNRGGYIDLTCDIDMGDIVFEDPRASPVVVLNLNGFCLTISRVTTGAYANYLMGYYGKRSIIKNGIIIVSSLIPSKETVISVGDSGSTIENLVLVNNSNSIVKVSQSSSGGIRRNIVCINYIVNIASVERYSCVYQNQLYSGLFFKKDEAKADDIDAANLPRDIFFISNYLGGKNICIVKTNRTFVAGVTSANGIPASMIITVLGSRDGARFTGVSDERGVFNINLGIYTEPVSVFSTDIINRVLRSDSAYSKGDVAITNPDNGVKFICTAAGITGDLPAQLPSSGSVTIGTAVFEVKNITPSSCAGPMIPANKYSNYGIKPK